MTKEQLLYDLSRTPLEDLSFIMSGMCDTMNRLGDTDGEVKAVDLFADLATALREAHEEQLGRV